MPEESTEEASEVALEAVRELAEESEAPWVKWAALSTMIMALFSAIGGLLAGKTANETIIARQMQISQLLHLNRSELHSDVLMTRLAVLELMGKEVSDDLRQRVETAAEAADKYSDEAVEDLGDSREALESHESLSLGTTILSTAITLIGMAVIVKRKSLWLCGLTIGACGGVMVATTAVQIFAG